MYKVEYSKDIKSDIEKLPKKEISKLLQKIEKLAEDPRPKKAEVLQGKFKGLHRIRSGDYRIVYQIVDERLIVLIVRIAHRREIYK